MPSGVYIRTDNCRKILSLAHLGKKQSRETCFKKSAYQKLRWANMVDSEKLQIYKKIAISNTITRVTRYCECSCGKTFQCKENSKQRFIHGHNRIRIKNEMRTCLCKCGGTFECKVNSNKRYIQGHGMRDSSNPNILEHRRKRAEKMIGRHPWSFGLTKETDERIRKSAEKGTPKRLSKICQRPNNFELKCGQELEKRFPSKFKYVGNGSVMINGKSPDFISEELKIVVLCNGIYWHLFRHNIVNTIENRKNIERKESQPFKDHGYKVWFIWEDIRELKEKLIDLLLLIVNKHVTDTNLRSTISEHLMEVEFKELVSL